MASQLEASYQDYSQEMSRIRVNITQMTAANFDAQVTLQNTLLTKILALQVENAQQNKRVIALNNYITGAAAANPLSQRENKLLVTYEDATTHAKTRMEIPLFDLTLLLPGTDLIDTTEAAWTEFVTAFEAVVVFPNTGNAVNVLTGQFVGKRT
jgi:hypothetical protein